MIAPRPHLSLLDLSRQELSDWLAGAGEDGYRADQIQRWVHEQVPIVEMHDLPGRLRTQLSEGFVEGYLPVERVVEGEGADRFLFRLHDGEAVESVRIGPHEDYTACLSTQVGCHVRCAFCASGKYGWTRNLTAGEIVGQVLALRRETARPGGVDGWPRHLVYMGMGEPFQNYGATLESIRRLIDPKGIDFGARRITISTAGLIPEIYRFAGEDLQVGLAVSLHAPNSELRRSIMPIEEVYPLAKLLKACAYYLEKTGRRLTFEYVLLAGVNDTPREAKRLVELFKDWKLVHINLIRYNPIGMTRLKAPTETESRGFLKRLVDGGLQATLRRSPGKNIDAACGQLRGLEYEKAGARKQDHLSMPS